MVRGYVHGADLGKRGSCHLFRLACATHPARMHFEAAQELRSEIEEMPRRKRQA